MTDTLVERLLAVDDVEMGGVCEVSVYRNPDGPEAAARIQAMQREIDRRDEALNRAQVDLAYIERMPTHGMDDQSYINAMRRNIGEAIDRIRKALSHSSETKEQSK